MPMTLHIEMAATNPPKPVGVGVFSGGQIVGSLPISELLKAATVVLKNPTKEMLDAGRIASYIEDFDCHLPHDGIQVVFAAMLEAAQNSYTGKEWGSDR